MSKCIYIYIYYHACLANQFCTLLKMTSTRYECSYISALDHKLHLQRGYVHRLCMQFLIWFYYICQTIFSSCAISLGVGKANKSLGVASSEEQQELSLQRRNNETTGLQKMEPITREYTKQAEQCLLQEKHKHQLTILLQPREVV